MRKQLLLVFFVLATYGVYAQKGKISMGLHAGAGLVSLRGNDIVEYYQNPDLRLNGGVTLRVSMKNNIFFAANLNYESKGADHDRLIITDQFGNDLGYANPTTKLNYLILPLRAGKEFGSRIRYNIQAGVFGGLLLKEKYIADFEDGREDAIWENASNFRKVDFGLSTGIGISIPAGKKWRAGLELTSDLGFVDLSTMPGALDGGVKTNAINLRIVLMRTANGQ